MTRKLISTLFVLTLCLLGSSMETAQGAGDALWLTDWIEHNGHEYRMTGPMNWTVAEFLAQKNNAHLVTINTGDENAWVFNTFSPLFSDQKNGAWIGMWDGQQEGSFVWVNGEPVAYTNWMTGEPNNLNAWEDCVHMTGPTHASSSKWNDFPPEQSLVAILERPLSGSDPGPVVTHAWLTDWIEHNGNEYRMTAPMNWTAAEFQARANGAHLVTINDADENNWIFNTLLPAAPAYIGAWIGIWDGETEGAFRWISGEPVTYVNWKPNVPNDNGGIEDYGHIYTSISDTPIQWNDWKGGHSLPGIVERRISNAIATHSGSDSPRVGVSILSVGDRNWEFGAILGNGHFAPIRFTRTHPRDGKIHRLGFRRKSADREVIPLDDPRVAVETGGEQPDGTFRRVVLTLNVDDDDVLEREVILQVRNLADGLEPVHLPKGP